MWKLEECLFLIQMLTVMRLLWGKEKNLSSSRYRHFLLDSQILLSVLFLLNLPVPILVVHSAATDASGSSSLPAQFILPVCNLPTTNLLYFLYKLLVLLGVVHLVFPSQSSFSVQRILFNISVSQQHDRDAFMNGLSVFVLSKQKLSAASFTSFLHVMIQWKYSHLQPWRPFLPEPNPVGNLISHFQLLELQLDSNAHKSLRL